MDVIVETQRLYLRRIAVEDDVAMYELDSNPKVHEFLYNKPLTDIEQSREIIRNLHKQYAETGIGRLAVILKETDQFIGWAGLKVEHDVNGRSEFIDLGYRFIEKYWNKGYATEATNALLQYGFCVLNFETINAYVCTQHIASRRVLEKCGFKEVEDAFLDDGDNNWWLEYKRIDYTRNDAM